MSQIARRSVFSSPSVTASFIRPTNTRAATQDSFSPAFHFVLTCVSNWQTYCLVNQRNIFAILYRYNSIDRRCRTKEEGSTRFLVSPWKRDGRCLHARTFPRVSHWYNGDIITPPTTRMRRGRYQPTRALAFPTIAVPNARTLPLPLVFHPHAESSAEVQYSAQHRSSTCAKIQAIFVYRTVPSIALHNCAHVRECIFLSVSDNARCVQNCLTYTLQEQNSFVNSYIIT